MALRGRASAPHSWAPISIGIVGALVFVVLSSSNPTGQGLYYDELHQATGAFAYKGIVPEMFSTMLGGIPVFNMPYSGAIKTGIYGLYLRWTGASFSVLSWRMLGVIFVAVGILLFSALVGARLPLLGHVSFLFLVMTDSTVILASRHDWGPVALAFMLRLAFLGVWMRGEMSRRPLLRNTFALGAIVGIALFEKLASAVLFGPLLIALLASENRRRRMHWIACGAGLVVGALPLVAANIYAYSQGGAFVSTHGVFLEHPLSLAGFVQQWGEYLSLGAGALLRKFILGSSNPTASAIEGWLLGGILLCLVVMAAREKRGDQIQRLSITMLICYVVLGLLLYCMPRATWAHHWVMGTPFQYAAIGLATAGLRGTWGRSDRTRKTTIALVSLLLVGYGAERLYSLLSLEKCLLKGEASVDWDPSLTKVGEFASHCTDATVFIAADWGVGTQIYCLSGGRPGFVHELFWNYQGPEDIERVAQSTGAKTIYVVAKRPVSTVSPDVTRRIFGDLGSLDGWTEVQVESEVAELTAVSVRKIIRSKGGP